MIKQEVIRETKVGERGPKIERNRNQMRRTEERKEEKGQPKEEKEIIK